MYNEGCFAAHTRNTPPDYYPWLFSLRPNFASPSFARVTIHFSKKLNNFEDVPSSWITAIWRSAWGTQILKRQYWYEDEYSSTVLRCIPTVWSNTNRQYWQTMLGFKPFSEFTMWLWCLWSPWQLFRFMSGPIQLFVTCLCWKCLIYSFEFICWPCCQCFNGDCGDCGCGDCGGCDCSGCWTISRSMRWKNGWLGWQIWVIHLSNILDTTASTLKAFQISFLIAWIPIAQKCQSYGLNLVSKLLGLLMWACIYPT